MKWVTFFWGLVVGFLLASMLIIADSAASTAPPSTPLSPVASSWGPVPPGERAP